MKKLIITTLGLLIFLTALLTLSSQTQATTNNIVILSHTGYLDSEGNYHVVGEVQNHGSETVNFVQVQAAFYTSQNTLITTRFDLTMLYTILPNRKTPFLIALLDTTQSAKVHNYTLTTSFLTTSPIPIGLRILSHDAHIDPQGRIHITGQIKNTETTKARNIKIIATCYNQQAKVVAAAQTDLDPIENDLEPNQTRPFEILMTQERAPYVWTYQLTAESLEYAIIPEHPTTLLLILILTTTLTLLTRNRKKQIKQKNTSFSPKPGHHNPDPQENRVRHR